MALGPDLVDVLVGDHRVIDRLLSTVAADGAGDAPADTGDRHLSMTIAELARHITIEEDYLYPLVREIAPGGDVMAATGLSQADDAEQLMKRLERAPRDVTRTALVNDLAEVLRGHVEATEHDVFPALRRTYPPDQLAHLAGVVEMARRTAPTRAHPGAPSTPPWNQILTPGIGLVDKVRDALTGRRTKPDRS